MPLREIISLAFESLYSNKLRAALTMLGMIIGVGAVVLLVSIGNGAKNYITQEFEGLGTNLLIIQPGRTDKKMGFGPPIGSSKEKLTLGDVDALERQATHLEAVAGVVFGAGTVKMVDHTVNVNIIGTNEKLPQIFNIKIEYGEFITEEDEIGRRVAVLGHGVAHNLFSEENPIGKMVKINDSEHRIVGVTMKMGSSLGFNFDDMVFIPTKTAMKIFNEDKLFGIRTKAKSKASVDDATAEITEILKQRHNGEVDFTIVTQYSMLETMNTILGMLTYVLAGIAMISMLVGGIGIMNIMLVSVTERTREIGIRRAVGARQIDILWQFLSEAVTLSLLGGGIGLFGSVTLTYFIAALLPKFNMRAPLWIILPAFLMSSLTGILFGVWPAKKASKLETMEALRFE